MLIFHTCLKHLGDELPLPELALPGGGQHGGLSEGEGEVDGDPLLSFLFIFVFSDFSS